MPAAARVGDMHTCPAVTVLVPHVGGPILPPGAVTVLIGGMPAARVTDMCVCVGPPDAILMGCPTVLICGLAAARMTDPTVHGGVIVAGCPTVMIGDGGGGGGGGGASASSGSQLALGKQDAPANMNAPKGGGAAAGASTPSAAPAAPISGPGALPFHIPSAGEEVASGAALQNPAAQAEVLKKAAEEGTPLVERCPAAG
jgi:uncharacterized Zn-binding protein involved in type VI secretion